jgi:small subunit ribosomal protein S20
MPNTKAAIKALKQSQKKHEKNKAVKSELRTLAKTASRLIGEKNRSEADEVLTKLESRLDKAAKTNVIHRNNASRKISRLRSQWAGIEE